MPPGERKIRILQVLYNLEYGGSERLASFLAYSVDRTRFETSILGLYGGGPISEELNRHRVPFSYFYHYKGPGRRGVIQMKLYQLIRRRKIDIIQVHGSYPFTRLLPAAKLTNTRIICTLHSKHTLQTVGRLRTMFRICARLSDRIVVVSNALKQCLDLEIGISKKKITVIHNGVDLTKFNPDVITPQSPTHEINDPIRVGVIGRLRDAKDHAGLFKAWTRVTKVHAKSKLLVVGDGVLRNSLEKLVRDLNISASVTFLGQQDDLPKIISQMDLVVLPSKRESFPISILEAMAMKKPIIATSVGGIPEMISHGRNGFLVPPQDPEALADAILLFMKDPKLFQGMAVEAYHTVNAEFSDKLVINKYEELYHQVNSP